MNIRVYNFLRFWLLLYSLSILGISFFVTLKLVDVFFNSQNLAAWVMVFWIPIYFCQMLCNIFSFNSSFRIITLIQKNKGSEVLNFKMLLKLLFVPQIVIFLLYYLGLAFFFLNSNIMVFRILKTYPYSFLIGVMFVFSFVLYIKFNKISNN